MSAAGSANQMKTKANIYTNLDKKVVSSKHRIITITVVGE